MNKVLYLLLMLSLSCAHNQGSSPSVDHPEVERVKRELHQLKALSEQRWTETQYFIEHDKCFITYGICLGENKLDQKSCWNRHEQCVIFTYRKWKQFLQ